MSDVEVREPVLVQVDELTPAEWNPNEQSDTTFAALVDQIREQGFLEPVLVTPVDGGYLIVGGEHRWRAAKVLGMPEIPAVVLELADEDVAKTLNVRHNVVRGKINPAKFTALFNALSNRYGPEAVKRMMGVNEESQFRQLYRDVRQSLPREARKRLDATKEELRSVDDLARVLQRIMAEGGSQLEESFIVFSFGGREHVMVRAQPRTWKNLMRIARECEDEGVDVNTRLNALLEAYHPF